LQLETREGPDLRAEEVFDKAGRQIEADFLEILEMQDDEKMARTVNTSDPNRVFHTFEKWECYQAGFYATTKEGVSQAAGEGQYREFLADPERFADALGHVTDECARHTPSA
jgi:hypothetical protein